MTRSVSYGVSIGFLLQIVSIFWTHVDLGRGSCFSSLTASSLRVWWFREAWFNFQITCVWLFHWPSRVSENSARISISAVYHVRSLSESLYVRRLSGGRPLEMWFKACLFFHLEASVRAIMKTVSLVFHEPSSQKKWQKKTLLNWCSYLLKKKNKGIVSHFRLMATAQKPSTKNVCHDWRATKSVLFFRSASTTLRHS